jgi:membrane-bound lytic murein transglycosylase D
LKLKRSSKYLIAIVLSLIIISFGYAGWCLLNEKTSEFKPSTNLEDSTLMLQLYPPVFPSSANFCSEPVPFANPDVRERFDRELLINSYFQGSNLYNMKLKMRWFKIMEPILAANGIPDDFKYLCLAESGLQQVVSKSNAVGFWQFLEETGKRYGLEINEEVDERYDVEKSTLAACKYFKHADTLFDNWTCVAASYNCGYAGLQKFMDNQKQKYYYDLLLPEETMRYVFRILALKELFIHPTKYGFNLKPSDFYPAYNYKTIEVDGPIPNLADFAIENGTNYKMLKVLNPWLRGKVLTNAKKKTYQIKIWIN